MVGSVSFLLFVFFWGDARDFSCVVSGFGQVLKSVPREKPLDQSAIPLIAPSQLQPRLYQNIQNLDVLLIGSLEISNVSNALTGLQSQKARDRDAGGLKVSKIKSKQSKHTSRTYRKYQMHVRGI